jgi:hypothetical protein
MRNRSGNTVDSFLSVTVSNFSSKMWLPYNYMDLVRRKTEHALSIYIIILWHQSIVLDIARLSIFGHFQIDCSLMTLKQIFQYNKNHWYVWNCIFFNSLLLGWRQIEFFDWECDPDFLTGWITGSEKKQFKTYHICLTLIT